MVEASHLTEPYCAAKVVVAKGTLDPDNVPRVKKQLGPAVIDATSRPTL